MSYERMIDVCPVCSAQNTHLLADMCERCERGWWIVDNLTCWIDSYFYTKGER